MEVPAPLAAIYEDTAERVVVKKAAQMGFSEWGINLALWCADAEFSEGCLKLVHLNIKFAGKDIENVQG